MGFPQSNDSDRKLPTVACTCLKAHQTGCLPSPVSEQLSPTPTIMLVKAESDRLRQLTHQVHATRVEHGHVDEEEGVALIPRRLVMVAGIDPKSQSVVGTDSPISICPMSRSSQLMLAMSGHQTSRELGLTSRPPGSTLPGFAWLPTFTGIQMWVWRETQPFVVPK